MGKKSRLKETRRRFREGDNLAPIDLSVDKMVKGIILGGEVIPLIRKYLSQDADIDALAKVGLSMLQAAGGMGNLEVVKFLLAEGANPNRRGVRGSGALHVAVESDNPEVVRALLEAGAMIEGENEDGMTAMQKAVQLGYAAAVEVLGEAGAEYRYWPRGGNKIESLLQVAVANGYPKIVKTLVKLGADPNMGSGPVSPLFIAAVASNYEMMSTLLSCGVDFTVLNDFGHTALNEAASSLNTGAVQALLEAGADPNQVDGNGATPLRVAVGSGNLPTMELLLDAGAKIDAVEKNSATALNWACRLAAPEVVQLLLDRGADCNRESDDGMTPMHMVAISPSSYGFSGPKEAITQRSDYERINAAIKKVRRLGHNKPGQTVSALVKAGASVDQVNRQGNTPMHNAVSIDGNTLVLMSMAERLTGRSDVAKDMAEGFVTARNQIRKVIKAYLENGADIELRSGPENQTPLNMASQSGTAEAVETLVKAGADLEAKNSSGHTPLHEAVVTGETESIRILVAAGADTTAKTPKGETPADLAANARRNDAEEALRTSSPSSG